jgi:cytochrome c oxidase assembly protein subunit 15
VPFVFFFVKGYVVRREWPKYLLMFALGGMQGLLGWYMVKSGLVDVPHVSQYRLTAHLFAAFLIYAYMFWVAMSLLFPTRQDAPRHSWYGKTLALFTVVSVTIVSGGFVAGLKAGKIYNTFPMMGDYWIPPGLMALEPPWRNFFDNMVTAQFDHRLLAITTFVLIVAYWFATRSADLPARARRAANALLHTAIVQVALGIATLLFAVPVVLGAAHQGVAMILFTVALYLVHALRRT